MSTVAVGARLSTTSEGLWLIAALAGVSRVPAVLKVRPVGDVDGILAEHPGLAVLEEAGIYHGGVL
ncbi:MAG: ESX secretion-associated protein EspG, partial [Mycobacteriaceae bacterium]|nr:ESX secretion-associated protein EspG [Mycobacteriaceae bacterium]